MIEILCFPAQFHGQHCDFVKSGGVCGFNFIHLGKGIFNGFEYEPFHGSRIGSWKTSNHLAPIIWKARILLSDHGQSHHSTGQREYDRHG